MHQPSRDVEEPLKAERVPFHKAYGLTHARKSLGGTEPSTPVDAILRLGIILPAGPRDLEDDAASRGVGAKGPSTSLAPARRRRMRDLSSAADIASCATLLKHASVYVSTEQVNELAGEADSGQVDSSQTDRGKADSGQVGSGQAATVAAVEHDRHAPFVLPKESGGGGSGGPPPRLSIASFRGSSSLDMCLDEDGIDDELSLNDGDGLAINSSGELVRVPPGRPPPGHRVIARARFHGHRFWLHEVAETEASATAGSSSRLSMGGDPPSPARFSIADPRISTVAAPTASNLSCGGNPAAICVRAPLALPGSEVGGMGLPMGSCFSYGGSSFRLVRPPPEARIPERWGSLAVGLQKARIKSVGENVASHYLRLPRWQWINAGTIGRRNNKNASLPLPDIKVKRRHATFRLEGYKAGVTKELEVSGLWLQPWKGKPCETLFPNRARLAYARALPIQMHPIKLFILPPPHLCMRAHALMRIACCLRIACCCAGRLLLGRHDHNINHPWRLRLGDVFCIGHSNIRFAQATRPAVKNAADDTGDDENGGGGNGGGGGKSGKSGNGKGKGGVPPLVLMQDTGRRYRRKANKEKRRQRKLKLIGSSSSEDDSDDDNGAEEERSLGSARAPLVRLEIVDGPWRGKFFTLEQSHVTIGSSRHCSLPLPTDLTVEEIHACLLYIEGSWYLHDLGSRSGTSLLVPDDGAQLDVGDVATLGTTEIAFFMQSKEPPLGGGDEAAEDAVASDQVPEPTELSGLMVAVE